jgi:hypothetical protein
MKNKYYYMIGSAVIIVVQSISLWYAGSMRLKREKPVVLKEDRKIENVVRPKAEGNSRLEERVRPRLKSKAEIKKADQPFAMVEKKKTEKKSDKKMDIRTGETYKLPEHLYLLISSRVWYESSKDNYLPKSEEIYFLKEEQLQKLSDESDSLGDHVYVILKVKTEDVQGRWLYRSHAEKGEKYFHLIEGTIPRAAVLEVRTFLKGF